jgi:hypothetical protein
VCGVDARPTSYPCYQEFGREASLQSRTHRFERRRPLSSVHHITTKPNPFLLKCIAMLPPRTGADNQDLACHLLAGALPFPHNECAFAA